MRASRATVTARFPHQSNRLNKFKKLFVLLAVLLLAAAINPSAHAQSLTVLHTFMGEESQDGAQPTNGVVMDAAGNLYGTTNLGGLHGAPGDSCYTFEDDGGCGTVFKLARHGSEFVYSTLYKFQALPDGNYPLGIVVGPDGTLYGATGGGGIVNNQGCANFPTGCGIVFRLRPPPTFCPTVQCPWGETIVHSFTGMNGDGGSPGSGDLIFDRAGNFYGTTQTGGATNAGTAYEFTPAQGGWTESILYSFNTSQNIAMPNTGMLMDQAGNFYGSTGYSVDGNPNGGIYQLVHSQSGWSANALQIFNCIGGINGCDPESLIFDPSGNLLVPMDGAGFHGQGTVIELQASSNWSIDLLYTFQNRQGFPAGRLTRDAAGNLYGTATDCATGFGCIYKLTPSDGSYVYSELYDFTGRADGQYPSGPVIIDAHGNLYGTAQAGGDESRCLGEGINGCGTVWELTP